MLILHILLSETSDEITYFMSHLLLSYVKFMHDLK